MEKRDSIINITDLNKKYFIFEKDYKVLKWIFTGSGFCKEKKAIKNLSITVERGDVVGIIGKNGSGKSTLMQIVAGITYPTSGTVEVNGSVGALINLSAGFNPDYTGRENIYYKGMLLGLSKAQIDEIIEPICEFVELDEYFDLPLRMYSSGMSARLGFALAVFSNPDILIIDEVFAVGDREFQVKSKAKIMELFTSGKSILFSSHSEQLIREFCNKVLYMKNGVVVHYGDIDKGFELYNAEISMNTEKKSGKK